MGPNQYVELRRIAAIGDVHAEHGRLEVALDAIAGFAVDAILCTGDIVDGVGDPERCCALLNRHNVQCVRGNHDRWCFAGVLRDSRGATAPDALTDASREFLLQLPAVRELRVTGGLALLCHGIGTYDLEKITELDTEYSIRVNRPLQDVVAAAKYRVMINGHSHARLIRRVGSLTILNAGALCGGDPGFIIVDFERGAVQWYSIAVGMAALVEESSLASGV
jgi:predicted phosphodiesterase